MRKGILLAGLVLVLVLGVSAVWADDDAPKPGTPADNECNVGGVLYREENQDGCPTVWYWKAGWFLARFNRGFISRADFPKEFESVLPPLEKQKTMGFCWTIARGYSYSLLYSGVPNTLDNVIPFNTSDCSGPAVIVRTGEHISIVFADNLADAQTICNSMGKLLSIVSLYPDYPTAPANTYGCDVS